jgi:hypothetical protein
VLPISRCDLKTVNFRRCGNQSISHVGLVTLLSRTGHNTTANVGYFSIDVQYLARKAWQHAVFEPELKTQAAFARRHQLQAGANLLDGDYADGSVCFSDCADPARYVSIWGWFAALRNHIGIEQILQNFTDLALLLIRGKSTSYLCADGMRRASHRL